MKMQNKNRCALQVLIFKEWKRKGYSLFQSMNKIVVISVLTVMYLYSLPVVVLAAEQDTLEVNTQIDLDEIEVSAQRSPAILTQVARIISVIERKEIESSPAQSVQDLLEYVAGVDVRQRGAEGVQADISIRGGTFDQTLILLNGINISDPQTGHHNLNLPVSFNQVERIEVLEGPASRVYGPNAFSGAINIVTRKPDLKEIQANISGGSFGYFDSNLSGSFQTGNLMHGISVGRKSSNGYIDNTDFKILSAFYNNQLITKSGQYSFQFGTSQKGFGANSFYTPKYPNQYEETKTLFTSAKWESNSKFHFTPVVYWRNHHDRFELFRNNPASWYKTHNYHLTNTYGINLNSWIQWELGKTAFGVEYRSENILSNVLGDELDIPKKVPGEDVEFTKSQKRNTVSGFLEHNYYISDWTFTAGIMSNYISGSNMGVNFFPGIDASYQIATSLKIFAAFNTSLRMPTFTDLYYSGPTNIGNPDLKPEKSSTLEGGVKWNYDFVQGYFVTYYRKGTDIIDWVKQSSEDLWQPQNLTQLNSIGSEFQIKFNLKKKFGKNLPNTVSLNLFTNEQKKETGDFISNYVLDNLKYKFVGSVNQNITKDLTVDLKVTFQDREGTYTSFKGGNWANEVEYRPFWVFDSKLNYNWEKLNLFASVNNIFDINYYDLGNVIQPGRWIKAGLSYRISFE